MSDGRTVRIVCDTNVLISGVVFGGHARTIMDLARRGIVDNCISPEILAECERVLQRRKFGLSFTDVFGVMDLFQQTYTVVYPKIRIRAVADDPDDDCILEAADAARAECVISGDRHLLALDRWNQCGILSPARFIHEYFPDPA